MVALGFGQLIGKLIGRAGPAAARPARHPPGLVNAVRHAGRDVEDFIVERY